MRTFTSLLIPSVIALVATVGIFKHDLAEGSSFANPEAELRAALAAAPSISAKEASWRGPLLELYRQRGFTPLWFSGGHLSQQAFELTSELRRPAERGLRSTDYLAGVEASSTGASAEIL